MRTYSLADLPGVPKRFDRLFWHKVRMARFGPDIHFATTREIEEPFRVARCVVLHLEPFRTGLAIGWYKHSGLEEFEALTLAVRPERPPTKQELESYDDNRMHGPRAGGIRFSATNSLPSRPGGPGPRMVVLEPTGADD